MKLRTPRTGVTLMEVLIAIFILAVGMVSVMAFFPLGALNMVRSVRDQRVSQLAQNTETVFHTQWKRTWEGYSGLGDNELTYQARDNNIAYLDNHRYDTNRLSQIGVFDLGPSHPVFYDPIGYNLGMRGHVGNPMFTSTSPYIDTNPALKAQNDAGNLVLIDRVPMATYLDIPVTTRQQNFRMFALQDDMSFKKNGLPEEDGGGLDRGYRYSSAWVIQRERNIDRNQVHLYVLTFDNRPTDLPDNDVEKTFATVNSTLAFPVGVYNATSLQISYPANQVPKTRKGGWIMVAYKQTMVDLVTPCTPPRWKVAFHRVTGSDDISTTSRELSLEQPLNPPTGLDNLGNRQPFYDVNDIRVVVFEKLAEVFYRGIISPDNVPNN